ncbi:MAG: hypothetical protein JWP11_1302 [Frankiales bacterium]|nr:hypothetical protein [Frankiales bacterium]
MSQRCTTWVLYESPITDRTQLCVLWAIADAANDQGVRAFPGRPRIAELARCDKKTVSDVIKELEAAGLLLVRRPTVPGRGRHNEYAVVMGRDPDVVRDLAWPPSQRKRSTASDGDTEPAVDDDVDTLPDRGRSAPYLPKKAGRKGGGKEEERGRATPPYPEPDPEPEPAALRASRAKPARRSTAPAVDKRLLELKHAVDRRAAAVPWDLEPPQAAMIAAQLELCGLEALVQEAIACVLAKGAPRSARAWITPWELLLPKRSAGATIPAGSAGYSTGYTSAQRDVDGDVERSPSPTIPPPCGACDGHRGGARYVVDDEDRPLRPCPACHPSSVVAARF